MVHKNLHKALTH